MYTKDSFPSNAVLTKYAQDKYGIELDGRSSMDKLLNQLNEAQKNQTGLHVQDPEIPESNDSSSKLEQGKKENTEKKIVEFQSDPVGKGLALLKKRRDN